LNYSIKSTKKQFLKQLVLALGLFTFSINTQDIKKVILEQTVGGFTVKELKSQTTVLIMLED